MKWKLFSRSQVEVPEPDTQPVAETLTTDQRLKAMTYKELLQEFRVLCWQEKKLEREAKRAERTKSAPEPSRKNPYQGRGFRGYTLRKDIGYVWAEMETRPEHAKRSKFWKLSA